MKVHEYLDFDHRVMEIEKEIREMEHFIDKAMLRLRVTQGLLGNLKQFVRDDVTRTKGD